MPGALRTVMSVLSILYKLLKLVITLLSPASRASGWAHLPANVEPSRPVDVPAEGNLEAIPTTPVATPVEPVVPPPPPVVAEGPGPTVPVIEPPVIVPASSFESKIVDRRKVASQKHVYGKRDWSKVTGICLHQTACVLGENPPRWDTIGCHVGVTRSGKVIWLHDFNKLVVHGNQWNSQTVGIEIDGMYEGIEGNIKTFWRPKDQPNLQPQRPTEEAMESVRGLIRFICQKVKENGGNVRALVAHRQASENRQNDPGSAIWKRVALPMSEELGLNDGGPGFKLSTGYPIPEAWDPKRKGYKY